MSDGAAALRALSHLYVTREVIEFKGTAAFGKVIVAAAQVPEGMEFTLTGNGVESTARAGTWVLEMPSGDCAVMSDKAFQETFEAVGPDEGGMSYAMPKWLAEQIAESGQGRMIPIIAKGRTT
jgi:hypothetical protein